MYDSNDEKCWRSLGSRQGKSSRKEHDTAEMVVERGLAIIKQLLRYITYARRQTAIVWRPVRPRHDHRKRGGADGAGQNVHEDGPA